MSLFSPDCCAKPKIRPDHSAQKYIGLRMARIMQKLDDTERNIYYPQSHIPQS